MKKTFFYFAFAAFAAVCLTACSSNDGDDDNSKVKPVNLSTAKYADQAAQYQLSTPVNSGVYQLKSIDFTEGGNILLEIGNTSSSLAYNNSSYILEKATVSGDTYTMNGKIQGTIKVIAAGSRETRAASHVQLIINLDVKFSKTETLTFTTENGTTVTATKTVPTTADEAMKNLVRTWNIRGAIIDLSSKEINAYEDFDSKGDGFYMEDILNEAVNQGVNLTESEKDCFRKVVKSIEISSSKFIIKYADGGEDAADWSWGNAEKTMFKIKLKSVGMGNKFIADNSTISVAYNGNLCNLKLTTTITDNSSKKWDVILTMKLQAAE
ncbi:MAG: hypothetical protein IKR31_01505 [Prevotella sp.]|jgi:hypothetical protein|nr:hypothetical protein [Prevotella sp.]